MSTLVCFACLYDPPRRAPDYTEATMSPEDAVTVAAGAALCEHHLPLAGPHLLTSSIVIKLGHAWTPDRATEDE